MLVKCHKPAIDGEKRQPFVSFADAGADFATHLDKHDISNALGKDGQPHEVDNPLTMINADKCC